MSNLIAPPLWLALLLAAVFALLAWAARALTTSGAVSTFVVGAVIYGMGGGKFCVPLLTFFLTSSLLSRLGRNRKRTTEATHEKGATRDAGQVWANGGVATVMVLVYAYVVHRWPTENTRYLLMLYLAALATVNADTWATEIGSLSRSAPLLLRTGKPVAAGTSGAVSGLGLLGALAGAILIPLSVYSLWGVGRSLPGEFVAVAWAGFMGSLADSLLGASVQAQYRDPTSGALTERVFSHNRRTIRERGLTWINNDVVNFLASVLGVLFAYLLLRYAAYTYR